MEDGGRGHRIAQIIDHGLILKKNDGMW